MSSLTSEINFQNNLDLLQFTQGIELDKPLASFEIAVQKAWAEGLFKAGFVTTDELNQLKQALDLALSQIQNGDFLWRVEDEDIHMNLERFLVEQCGELGKKIHLGRSRNDLIATTLRLFTQSTCNDLKKMVANFICVLTEKTEKEIEVIIPGLTHLQFGQPIRLSQVYLSYAWALKRDLKRLEFAEEMSMLSLPLGSAALGGTHLPVDLGTMAETLGFANAPLNSFDAVGDRDFILQALQSFSSIALHLSKISEDVIIWSSQPYGWVSLPQDWSTGSSIMPNKRNPDVPELVRGKCAQIIGFEQSANLLLKGLVNSYSSDLHELKRVLLPAITQLKECLGVLPKFFKGLHSQPEKIKTQLQQGHLLATEVANHLVEQGATFRDAFKQVAELVSRAESQSVQVHQLSSDLNSGLSFESAVEKRQNSGGTSRSSILSQVKQLRNK